MAGSDTLLSRLVENLIDNAVCHNQPGGWVHVITQWKPTVRISSSRTEARSFTPTRSSSSPSRSSRIGAERTGSDGGSGLGLAIVSSILEVHGGTLDLEALTDGGLRVAISLPLAVTTASGAPA